MHRIDLIAQRADEAVARTKAGRREIPMRVRAVGDQHVERIDDAAVEVAVQIEARRELGLWPDDLAHAPKDVRLGRFTETPHLHRAVQREVDPIERTRVREARELVVEDRLESVPRDRRARHGEVRRERHRLHVAREPRRLHEARELGVRHEALELLALQRRGVRERFTALVEGVVKRVELGGQRRIGVRLVKDASIRDAQRTTTTTEPLPSKHGCEARDTALGKELRQVHEKSSPMKRTRSFSRTSTEAALSRRWIGADRVGICPSTMPSAPSSMELSIFAAPSPPFAS